ncbi:MAG: SPFH domain-containing protein [Gemmatimonadaceae bacterium]|nr:SPFH domain-containing protein [Gemmatimonadaceae bacterium]
MLRDTEFRGSSGYLMLAVLPLALLALLAAAITAFRADRDGIGVLILLGVGLLSVLLGGFFIVHPNEGKALTLFGKYVGTARAPGLWYANPFYTKKAVSLKVRNFETTKLKVNDAHANPVEIGAIVVWKVIDTVEALFEVDDYEKYVHMQSEAALRTLASSYPYDAHRTGEISLSTHTAEISKGLSEALHERFAKAGVEVIESRISHLAYAPEIAAAMLQRQQASAIVAARQTIVDGAVGMVESALDQLTAKRIVEFDGDRRAAMVSNLLVVLCSDRAAQPVVNTGSIYQ